MKRLWLSLILGLGLLVAGIITWRYPKTESEKVWPSTAPASKVSPSPSPSPLPSPSPSPLSFSQMNQLYGPCVYGPTLMFHHIAPEAANLTVTTEFFRKQMEYLRDRGYTAVGMADLIAFFDQSRSLPNKSVILTFDDAYDDFFTNAYPILKEFGFKATVFVPTGLVNNPGYLSWDQIREMNQSGLMAFANHTWSHNNLGGASETVNKEIGWADTQLTEYGLNSPKVLAYPYGSAGSLAEKAAAEKGYLLAFTTKPGSILCKKMRLDLPRIRIGNSQLNTYGF